MTEPADRPAARRPHDLGQNDMVLSSFTLGFDQPMQQRIQLAAANGFSGIGVYAMHYKQLESEGLAPGHLREMLDEHGICLAEIEAVSGLGSAGVGGDRAAEIESIAFRMADEFGSRYLQVIGNADMPIAGAGRAYGALCDRAADHGLVCGIEFLPFTDIKDVADARRIVEAAGRSNGGVCVDIWHHTRGANDLGLIADLPGEMITGIQMSDGPLVPVNPDYYTDCLENRMAPGEGEFDVAGFIETVRSTGTTVPWDLEVCSARGWADPVDHVARVGAGMRSSLRAAEIEVRA